MHHPLPPFEKCFSRIYPAVLKDDQCVFKFLNNRLHSNISKYLCRNKNNLFRDKTSFCYQPPWNELQTNEPVHKFLPFQVGPIWWNSIKFVNTSTSIFDMVLKQAKVFKCTSLLLCCCNSSSEMFSFRWLRKLWVQIPLGHGLSLDLTRNCGAVSGSILNSSRISVCFSNYLINGNPINFHWKRPTRKNNINRVKYLQAQKCFIESATGQQDNRCVSFRRDIIS